VTGAGAVVTARVRAHDTDRGRVLPAYAYVELRWSGRMPLEVRMSGCGQVTGTTVFARDLLAEALESGAAGAGRIRFRLAVPGPRHVPKLLVALDPDLPSAHAYAVKPDPVQAFLMRTFELVPAGSEPGCLPGGDVIAALLETS
jgi:hypothetical protein